MRSAAIVLGLVSFFTAGAALACSVDRIAEPRELVRDAQAILLVRVVSWKEDPALKTSVGGAVTFEVQEVLKGRFAEKALVLPGHLKYRGANDEKVPYHFIRPGGRLGMCVAWDYKSDGQFLLFMEKGNLLGRPLAPVNEEVSGPDDPWVLWVRRQLKKR
jgi:hypothetical protein